MKTLNKNSIMVGMLLGSMVIAGGAVAGVADSKHNLGSDVGGLAGRNQTTATAEVCVFCHTPHGSNTDAAVPLWNKALPLANTFSTYDSLGTSSLDGGITDVGSVSIACLSCHDGAQAMDVMVNTPGSGSPTLSGTWTPNSNGTVNAAGEMIKGADGLDFPMLGKDLTNDHPIGIQYAGGGIIAGTPSPATTEYGDEDFFVPETKLINGTQVWWLDTGLTGLGKRTKTDLPLYTRTDADLANTPEPFVECASCHDPHESVKATFLRIDNAGSKVCLACHNK